MSFLNFTQVLSYAKTLGQPPSTWVASKYPSRLALLSPKEEGDPPLQPKIAGQNPQSTLRHERKPMFP